MAFTQWFQLSNLVFVQGYNGPEIVAVKENNVEMTQKASVSALVANSYYHDKTNERIYIAPSDGTNPNTSGHTYIAYVWIGFCNIQDMDNRIVFAIQGQTGVYEYKPFIDMDRLPVIRSSISELYRQVVVSSLGSLSFINSIWWYTNRNNYIWHNALCILKKGNATDAYGSYITIFTGILKNPEFADAGVTFQYEDIMLRELKTIPQDRFSTDPTEYPDIDPNFADAVKPILLGAKTNITPICIDTVNFVYMISNVDYGLDSFVLNAINNVYKDGIALTLTTDYTVDLSAGTFTLIADPGTSEITCDAEGLKISYDFVGESWNNTYTQNIAEITFFILNKLNEISIATLDLTEFGNLKTNRDKECGLYLDTEIETTELLKKLQLSGEFHLLIDLDGKITVTPYSRSTAPTDPDDHFKHDTIQGFILSEDTDNIQSRAIVKYDEDPTNGTWLYQIGYRENVGHKYQTQRDIVFETIITNQEDASDLANTLIDFFDEEAIYVRGKIITGYGFDKKPLDKIRITRSVLNEKESETEIFDTESFMIKEIGKDLNTNTVSFLAVKDLAQLRGRHLLQLNGRVLLQLNGDALFT